MKWVDRLQKVVAFMPERASKSILAGGKVWIQVFFSVLVLFAASLVGDFGRRVPRSTDLELPPH